MPSTLLITLSIFPGRIILSFHKAALPIHELAHLNIFNTTALRKAPSSSASLASLAPPNTALNTSQYSNMGL